MHNPFKSLEKDPGLKARMKKRRKPAATAPAPAEGPREKSEDELFLHAFSDVVPLNKGGRDVAPAADRRPAPPWPAVATSAAAADATAAASRPAVAGPPAPRDAPAARPPVPGAAPAPVGTGALPAGAPAGRR